MHSPDVEVVTRSVPQVIQRDYGDALPSSKMRCTLLQACEVDVNTSKEDIANNFAGNTVVHPNCWDFMEDSVQNE